MGMQGDKRLHRLRRACRSCGDAAARGEYDGERGVRSFPSRREAATDA
jgi:hypothetical protein